MKDKAQWVTTKRKFPEETIDSMLKRFKRQVKNAGIIDDYKKNEYYVKPCLRDRGEK